MADITMCDNQDCESRNKCYRATATPSDWQSWAIFVPNEDGVCRSFVERVSHTRTAEKAVEF